MIHYQLRCGAAHEFDGWFTSSEGFASQSESGLISCPVCATTNVARALMSPAVPKKGRAARPSVPAPEPALPVQSTSLPMPDMVRAALHRLRSEVEKTCDYVGKDFAGEARRIHNGDTAPHGIYGESTEAEIEALADDGIEIAQLPWLPHSDS